MAVPYPGQTVPSAEFGKANRVPSPQAPVTYVEPQPNDFIKAIKIAKQNIPIGQAVKITSTASTEVAQRAKSINPYNNQDRAIGIPAHTPLVTPLGVHPQFLNQTVPDWYYTGGSNG
jgi:hypothetical protein